MFAVSYEYQRFLLSFESFGDCDGYEQGINPTLTTITKDSGVGPMTVGDSSCAGTSEFRPPFQNLAEGSGLGSWGLIITL